MKSTRTPRNTVEATHVQSLFGKAAGALLTAAAIACASGVFSSVATAVGPYVDPNLPRFVMGPPGTAPETAFEDTNLRELFDHPEQWVETRSKIDCLLFADHSFNIYSDEDLAKWLGMMKEWGLKLELEVGAVKEWKGQTGESTFMNQIPMWDRIIRLGGKIHSLAFDEPLVCVRFVLHKSDEYAIEETVKFIELVRKRYPDMLLGDIEGYPSIPLADHIKWLTELQKRLREKGIRPLDFYRLDVDWACFESRNQGNWREVQQLHEFCESISLPFSVIYWAPIYDYFKREEYKLSDDSTWYIGLMSQGYNYKMAGGGQEQICIESWTRSPKHAVPETGEWTFTRSVRDFHRKFIEKVDIMAPNGPMVKPKPKPAAPPEAAPAAPPPAVPTPVPPAPAATPEAAPTPKK